MTALNKFKDQCECCCKYKKCGGYNGKLLCDECKRIYVKSEVSKNKKIIVDSATGKKFEQSSLFGLGGLFNE